MLSQPATSQISHPASGAKLSQEGETHRDVANGLAKAIHHAGISVYCQDGSLRILWAQNMPPSWNSSRVVGGGDADLLPPSEAERLTAAKQRALASGKSETCEIALDDDRGPRWFDVWIDPANAEPEAPPRLLTTVVETTEHKRREQALKSLLREVSHRSKNLLAIIQSIATQTGRHAGSIESFLSRFRGRLQSLAASQDLVTLSNWRGADLRELIASQVSRYASDPRKSIRFEGANPYLNPNAALHIGLALHELAVNSMTYGALSQPGGFVSISTRHDTDEKGQKVLLLRWNEAIAPESREDGKIEKRFGSVALERIVPASLRGWAELDIGSESLTYALAVPVGTAGIE